MKQELKINSADDFMTIIDSKLEEHGTRDNKGKAAIASLLALESTIREMELVADRLEVSPRVIGKALALAMFTYRSGSPIKLKELIKACAVSELSDKQQSDYIYPLLVDLGVIVRESERLAYWQQWDKIGAKPSFFVAHVKPLFSTSGAKKEILKENDKALEQATKLKVIEKQNAIAQRAKLVALQAANAHAEAAKTLESVPSAPQSAGAFIKQYAMPLTVIGLLGIVVAGSVFSNGTPANTVAAVEMAAYPQPTYTASYPQPTFQPTYKGE